MKKQFFVITLFILFAAFPGFSRQLACELPSKEPFVLRVQTQNDARHYTSQITQFTAPPICAMTSQETRLKPKVPP